MANGTGNQALIMRAHGGHRPQAEGRTLEGFYDIEEILKKRIREGAPQYLIKWLGYPEEQNTWEPMENLQSCSYWVEEFEKSLKAGKKKSSHQRRQKGAADEAKKKQQTTRSTPCAEAQDGAPNYYVKLTTGYLAEDIDVSAPSTDPDRIIEILVKLKSSQTEDGLLIIFTAKRANGSVCTVTNKFLEAHYPDMLMDFYEQHFINSHYRKI